MFLPSWLKGLRYRSVRSRRPRQNRRVAVVAIVESLESRKLLTAVAAPVIANLGPNFAYTEGAPPSIVANQATITDGSNSFTLSKLSVTTTNGAAGDLLGVLNGAGVGMGPGGTVMFASSPTATPVQVGNATGGAGNTPLVISFNLNATPASVKAVLDQVGYGNGTSTLSIPDRSISFTFTDGKGVASAAVTKSIHVNPAPVIGNLSIPFTYTEGAPPAPVSPMATISDAPNAYANSKLSVGVVNGLAGDQLGIVNGAGVGMGPNGAVLFAASPTATPVVIGTVTGGTGATPLVVTFNASATQQGVQAVLDHIVYGNGMSTLPTPDRQVGIVFTDGNHVSSVPKGTGIHVNPAPVIGNLGTAPVNYKVNAAPVVLAPTGIIADAAPGGFANSKLSVQLSGGNASDQLGIQAHGALTVGANGTLLFNSVVVGAFSGGAGAGPLVITFNANATQGSVQAVLDNVIFSYRTTSTTPLLTGRLAMFVFTDHNNVASVPKVQGITITK